MDKQYNKLFWLQDKKPILYKGQVCNVYHPPLRKGIGHELHTFIWILLDAEKAVWEEVNVQDIEPYDL